MQRVLQPTVASEGVKIQWKYIVQLAIFINAHSPHEWHAHGSLQNQMRYWR